MLKEADIKRRKCKYLRIKVKDARVQVIAPYGTSLRTINDFVESKREWIEKTVKKQNDLFLRANNISKSIFYQGEIVETEIPVEDAYKRFYFPKLNYLSERIEELSVQYGFNFKRLRFSNARTLWGTCDRYNNIRLNWRLLALPSELCDYVMVHELVHTIHHNHSPSFLKELEKFLPDCKKRKRELKNYSWLLSAYR